MYLPSPNLSSQGSSVEGREGLWLSAEQHGSVTVVTIRGDLDIVSSGRFDDCQAPQGSRIFVDNACLARQFEDHPGPRRMHTPIGNGEKIPGHS